MSYKTFRTHSVPSDSTRNEGILMTNARIEEFKFQEVTLLKDELCGSGSYGRVCKAMVDQLVCAAKLIHPTFFSEISPSSTKTFQQFQQECDFLSAIRHPCIVQYLGTSQDRESGLLVLLMELMDESLTKYLERTLSRGKLVPYHKQVNFSHDICMALSFLHSNGIVHRDLSSNNILLVAESRVKVTDFGMSRLVEQNPRMTPLTQCPGCLVYMAPEALRTPPTYSEKLDVFSVGVCIIQIITCKFPKPGNAKNTVEDPRHGTIEVPIPERERRKDDISGIEEDDLLLATALNCLADSEQFRPTSQDLCHRMVHYKVHEKYLQSVAGAQQREEFLNNLEAAVVEKDHQISELRVEVDEKVAKLNSVVDTIAKKDYEIQRLKSELEQLQIELTEQVVHQRRNHVGSASPRMCSSPLASITSLSSELCVTTLVCLDGPIGPMSCYITSATGKGLASFPGPTFNL
jgi:serine/threonine-protein kinase TNNI3K